MAYCLFNSDLHSASSTVSPVRPAVQFPTIRASLLHWEGLRLTPYRDSDGRSVCVGIGHNLSAHRQVPKARYTAAEVEAFYEADLRLALRSARQVLRDFDSLPEAVRQVVAGLIWQVGPAGFQRFTAFHTAINWRAWDSAAAALRDSRWYQQTPVARATWALAVLRSQ